MAVLMLERRILSFFNAVCVDILTTFEVMIVHLTAMSNCKAFFDVYAPGFKNGPNMRILEIGSQDVNGSLREMAPLGCSYVGVDFVEGKGVDVVLDDPYALPFDDASFDMVVSSSCFEHSEMFWLVFLEILRVLKPKGLFYLNAPSNGKFHRYPVDCWRFYPDSGRALVAWAQRNSINAGLLESYVSMQAGDGAWNDMVAVFVKDQAFSADFQDRITDKKEDFYNALIYEEEGVFKYSEYTEDQQRLAVIGQIAAGTIRVL